MTFTLKYPMKRIYVHKCSVSLKNKTGFKRRHIRQSIVHLKLFASITYKVLNRRRNWFKSYFLCNNLAYLKIIYFKCLYELKHTFSRFRTLHFNNLRQTPPRLPDYLFTKQITCCSFTWVFHMNMYLSWCDVNSLFLKFIICHYVTF